jgi:hypothetical protein
LSDANGSGRSWWTTLPALLGAVAALITAGVGAAALFAGDGNGDGGNGQNTSGPAVTATGAGEPTTQEWSRQATDVCERFRDEFTSLGTPDPNDPAATAALLDQATAAAGRASDDLGDIPAPPAWENDIGELVSILDQEVLAYRNAASAMRNLDQVTFNEAFTEAQRLGERENALWAKLDVRGCLG